MYKTKYPTRLNRRDFLKLGGGVATAAGLGVLTGRSRGLLKPISVVEAAPGASLLNQAAEAIDPTVHLAGTDGWISLPETQAIPPYFPDNLAPEPFNGYVFGFRNVTGYTPEQVGNQVGKVQLTAPIITVNQEQDTYVQLTNLGLKMRPDLIDSHTFHWHGFRNAIPFFDGEPSSSVAIPLGRTFMYYFRPHDPGTYMYHCHFEDTEHVSMGMTGVITVRPELNQTLGGKFAFNDANTEYDREFVIFLTEYWAEAHWNGSHVGLTEWTDYKVDFWLMNGRAYPDTLAPAGLGNDAITGDLLAPAGYPHLQYQPISSLIQANAGEKILLRFVNLGFQESSMTLSGANMRVWGKDAMQLKGQDGTDHSYETHTISIHPGESFDAIFQTPAEATMLKLYNRNYHHQGNAGVLGYGGQMTDIIVHPAGTLAEQTAPNT